MNAIAERDAGTRAFRASVDLRLLKACAEAASTEATRYYLMGVHVTVSRAGTSYVGTNGLILITAHGEPIETEDDGAVIIPVKACQAFKLSRRLPHTRAELSVDAAGKASLTFLGETYGFSCIDGAFPDWRRVVPASVSGVPAQYDPRRLATLQRAAAILGSTAPIVIGQNGDGPALVDLGAPDAVGLVMPLRAEAPIAPPPWLQADPPAKACDDGESARTNPVAQPAHSPFGGSVAARILACPASVGLVAKVPEHLRKSSAYADRGTALHQAMALLIEHERSLDGLVGEVIGSTRITRDDVENALRPVLAYVDGLLDQPGAEYYLERRVEFPTVANAYGTADLLVRVDADLHVVDYKFGTGVRVRAVHLDGDAEVPNPQLAFYAAAARHSLPAFFAGVERITLTILQPQSIEEDAEVVSSVAVTPAELDAFVPIYRAACTEALGPSPRLARGPWCRFCPAKPVCPLHTGPLLDLARLAAPAPLPSGGALGAPADKTAYLQALAAGLDLVDAIRDLRRELHDQAKQALHAGDTVPGYALTKGRGERYWAHENEALAALIGAGFDRADLLDEVMRSPKQVELRAKARNLTVPKELIVSRPSGVSLVRAENARAPLPGRDELVRSFAEALEVLQEGNPS